VRQNFEILSINISKEKGVHKKPVGRATLRKDHGVVGDGHAGPWHRQVSLLASEDVEREEKKHTDLSFDYFTENITTRGVDLSALPIGTRLHLGDAVVEITQIGKEEQHHYTIEEHPREWVNIRKGVFAKVVQGGDIDTGSPCFYDETR
jgi:MOSC domain-containing protein YiiM